MNVSKLVRQKLLQAIGEIELDEVSDQFLVDLLVDILRRTQEQVKTLEGRITGLQQDNHRAYEQYVKEIRGSIYNHCSLHFFEGLEKDNFYEVKADIQKGHVGVHLMHIKGKSKVHYNLQQLDRGAFYNAKV